PAARLTLELDIGQFTDRFPVPPPASAFPAPNFHDIAIPRLAAEWLALARERLELRVRAGYAYEPAPTPEQVGDTNFADSNKHTAAAGAGISLRGLTEILPRPITLDLFFALTVLEDRLHRKLSPVDPVGDYRSAGAVLAAGLTSSWRF